MPEAARLRRRSEDLALVEAEDRITLLDLRALERPPLVLEGTAMDVWALLDGTRSLDAVAAELADRYDAPVDEVSAGVRSFAEQLDALDLLDRQEPHD